MAKSNPCYNSSEQPAVALVLSGGGARAAYQVGVMKAVSDIVYRSECGNPFPIITGTSAGAINASVLASYSKTPRVGVRSLQKVWENFSVDQIYRSDFIGIVKNTFRWIRTIFSNDFYRNHKLGLFNNSPLVSLLDRVIHYDNIQKCIDSKQLKALCVTASCYTTGQTVSFYQSEKKVENWERYRRIGEKTRITKAHLLASASIPLVFSAVKIGNKLYGDGSVRFLAPLSPAIHLGADKIFIIGVDPENKMPDEIDTIDPHYPSIGEVAGHVLDSVFIDSLNVDMERIKRVNQTISLIPEQKAKESGLRPIETFVISPSKDLSRLASKHFNSLPWLVRFLFKRFGIGNQDGSNILSYILFESNYTKELIDLGYKDAMEKKQNILNFFNHSS
ncbi:MAG: patatin-like phospholipase family protein [Gammaproteobacteria bacterium]|nr:patatin-like phospholipase family protein [Gammaproteobacteria bacterium]